MRKFDAALVAAIACSGVVSTAAAQQLRQPPSALEYAATPTSHYNYYAQEPAQESPSDIPAPMPEQEPGDSPVEPAPEQPPAPLAEEPIDAEFMPYSSIPAESYRQPACRSACGRELEPWRLFDTGACSRTTIGGWVSGGYYANGDGDFGDQENRPLGFNNIAGGQLNQAWIYAERDADTGGCGFDWGYRVDFMWGADGPDTQAFGDGSWDIDWDTSNEYGFALPQLYGEVAYNDLSVKFGHFYTIIGWEVVPAPDNFFYSHAYTMYYGEPFTHTGVLAEYAYNDYVTLFGGYTFGWDSGFDNSVDASTWLGGVALTLSDDLSITFANTFGDLGDGGVDGEWNQGWVYMQSVVAEYAVSDDTTYIFQTDFGRNDQLDALNPGVEDPEAEWYGINQYLIHDINDCWAAGLRLEWFRDDDGGRLPAANNQGGGVVLDSPGSYWALTAGLNYKPSTNLIIRPEVRYDWFDGEGTPFDPEYDPAVGDLVGTDDDQFYYGLDAIFTY